MGSTRAFSYLFLTVSVLSGFAPACASDEADSYLAEDEAAADVAQSNSALTGSMTYVLQRSSNPSADELDAYARITTAMNAAVTMYNGQTTLSRQIYVQYVPSVPTADGNMNGTIRFGSNRSYMTQRTAMHEIGHVMGVGQSTRYKALVVNGKFIGSNALAMLRSMVGESPTSELKADQQHFWPYGLNYESEWSTVNGQRQARIVAAMKQDGI